MPCLDAIDRLTELGLADSVGVCSGFTISLINRHLLMADTGGVCGGGGALYFCGILVSVIRYSKVKEFSSSIFVVRIYLNGASIIEARRFSSIDIYSLAWIQSR